MGTLAYGEQVNLAGRGARQDDAECDLDSIFWNWQYLAALAWQGYATLGCGAVVVSLATECVGVGYASGIVPQAYAAYVERYDPHEQIVVVVRHPDRERIYLLAGKPAPWECGERSRVQPMNGLLLCIPRGGWKH